MTFVPTTTVPPALIEMQPVRSVLWVTREFRLETTRPYPNAWIRFWYKVLLDWEWKRP